MQRERANERACDHAIKKTLAYRAVFKYPVSYHQLHNSLISNRTFKKSFFDKELSKLVKKGYIGYRDGKYFHKSIKPVSWDFRAKHSQMAFEKALNAAKYLKKIPWIKMLGVTGSVAAYNADRDADIDIFVVAQTHRLWLTRGFVAAILKALKMYSQNGTIPGKMCPNLFIDEEAMEWQLDQRSIFTAHEIILLHPIIDKDNTYLRFLKKNKWIKDYLNTIWEIDFNLDDPKQKRGSRFVNLLEKIAKYFQMRYMKNKMTNELITDHMLHFRKNDNTHWILDTYKNMSKGDTKSYAAREFTGTA